MSVEKDFWNKKIADWYAKTDWAKRPSIFVESVKEYYPGTGKVLELGCGAGQDGLWLASQGYDVTQTDLIEGMFPDIRRRAEELGAKTELKQLDLLDLSSIEDSSFDVVHAHLSLHYFDKDTTEQIFKEIYRILRPGGVLSALFNSTSDPENNEGEEIEPHYRKIGSLKKRFLDIAEARHFAEDFNILLADDEGETYKDRAIGTKNLIRLVAKK